MPWTESQQKAIDSRDKNLLISAAAGSGKTSVLVERVIQLILSGEYDISRMLIVTFTNAAAAEMRSRISRAIELKIQEPDDLNEKQIQHLNRQLIFLPSASIQTIHSFCKSLMQRYFAEININPQFRIATEQELKILQQEILEDMFEEKYTEADEDFLKFSDFFSTSAINNDRIYSLILKLYTFSQSQPFPEKWISSLPDFYDLPPEIGLTDLVWWSAIEDDIFLSIDAAIQKNISAWKLANKHKLDKHAELLESELVRLNNIKTATENKNILWIIDRLSEKFATLPRTKSSDEIKEVTTRIRDFRDDYKKILKNLKQKYFYQSSEEEIIKTLRNVRKSITILTQLTLDFMHRLQTAKKDLDLLDFNDLEHFTLKILLDENSKPTSIAENLQRHFQIVMVDEYQDTNGVQELILQTVSNGKNLFIVGDVKQSIYRFRLADPSLFIAKYESYPKLSEQGQPYEKIDLSVNFRSRREVIETVNFVFEQLMNRRVTEIDYDENSRLYYAADYPNDDVATEFFLIDGKSSDDGGSIVSDLKGAAREGQVIANRIKQLIADKFRVYDRKSQQYRQFEYRDAVILMRSVKDDGEQILEVLKKNNIPSYTTSDAGYLNDLDVRLIISTLSIIDNARQDIPLAAVICSQIGKLSHEELAKIRSDFPAKNLISSLQKYLDQDVQNPVTDKINAFFDLLRNWKIYSQFESVTNLIWKIFADTGYYDFVGALPDGTIRQANLRLLIDYASNFESMEIHGLFKFLHYIRKIRRVQSDFPTAKPFAESENVVRIMTIHQSKGLEFPIVFVAGLGKGFNLSDAQASDFLIHRELGIGSRGLIATRHEFAKFPTIARNAIAYVITKESKAEELRTLYVALTRAKEKLILVGTATGIGSFEKKFEAWKNISKSEQNLYNIFTARNFLDWLVPALMKDDFLNIEIIAGNEIRMEIKQEKSTDPLLENIKLGKDLPSSPDVDMVESILSWKYPYEGSIPSKVTVTELKRRFTDDEDQVFIDRQRIFKRPKFMQENHLSNVEYGTIVHRILQRIDLTKSLTESGIRSQVENLVNQEILTQDQVESVKLSDVSRFFRSDLGKRLLTAEKIHREIQFTTLITAQRFFPDATDSNAKTMLQGIIDLLFVDKNGKLVLVDYKTDVDNSAEHARARYKLQIELYSEAVEQIFNHRVDERFLYMLHGGIIVPM